MGPSANQLQSLSRLGLAKNPVAVAFLARPPEGVQRVSRPAPAGCSYWRSASEGHVFYTTPDDHVNCPIGAHTHGVDLTPQQGKELEGLIGTMVELKYLKLEEVPSIPRLARPLEFAAYGPLGSTPFPADLIVFRGNVRQIMLLSEAARAAGVFEASATLGRPACAMVPAAIASDSGVASVSCIGNRVYTGLSDDELYLAIPGSKLAAVLEHLPATITANAELEQYHQRRQREFS